MNCWIILTALLCAAGGLAGTDDEAERRLAEPSPDRRPVEIEEQDDGSIVYVIPDIRTPRWAGRRLGFGRAMEFFRGVLGPTFTVDPKSGEVRIPRDRPFSDLEERIERCARGNGFMPYWEELVARAVYGGPSEGPLVKQVFRGDLQGTVPEFVGFLPLPKREGETSRRFQLTVRGTGKGGSSRKAKQIHEYVIDKRGGHFRLEHTYSRPEFGKTIIAPGRQEFLDVTLGPKEKARFRVNRLAPHCNGGEMFCLRLVDGDEKQLWRNDTAVYGRYRLMRADFEDDGRDELVLFREGHLVGTVLIFTIQSAEEERDPAPAVEPEKSSG